MRSSESDMALIEAQALAKAYRATDAPGLERLARDVIAETATGDVREAFNRLVAAHLRAMAQRLRNGGW